VIATYTCQYGQQIDIPVDPTKDTDTYYTYTFTGWDNEIAQICTADATYTALFSKKSHSSVSLTPSTTVLYRGDKLIVTAKLDNMIAIKIGTVTLDYNADILELIGGTCLAPDIMVGAVAIDRNAGTFMLNNEAVLNGDIFTFEFRVKADAAFADTAISAKASIGTSKGNDIDTTGAQMTVECKHEYTPWVNLDNTYKTHNCPICGKVETVYIEYTITFQYDDGSIISQMTYHYGQEVQIPEAPEAPDYLLGRWEFTKWDAEVSGVCLGDAVYTAQFIRLNPYGDIDCNMQVTSDDVIMLLLHVTMPDQFPVDAEADFTGDGLITSDDVILLLLHVTMPDQFPLDPKKKEELL
jgi:hypothetical protein